MKPASAEALLLIAAGFSQAPNAKPILTGSQHAPDLPEGARILYAFDGAGDEHLGIGVSGIGDLNGDGVPDLLIGAMGGGLFGFGPGYVRAFSGKDGSLLYQVDGLHRQEGDAFGEMIAPLVDMDGDGVTDFAVGAWRFNGYTGYVKVFSGKEGCEVYTLYGGELTGCEEGFCGPAFGSSICGLGDLDGDGRTDFVVGSNKSSRVFSGASGRRLYEFDELCTGRAPDVDGDGVPDLVTCHAYGSAGCGGILQFPGTLGLRSGRDGSLLARSPFEPEEKSHWGETGLWAAGLGDLDADGFVDVALLLVPPAHPRPPPDPNRGRGAPLRPHELCAYSGRDGSRIWSAAITDRSVGDWPVILGIGDVDGDGHGDLMTRWQDDPRRDMAQVELRSGRSGKVIQRFLSDSWTLGARSADAGDLDGDGRSELLIGDYEQSHAGRAYVLSFGRL